MLRYAHIYRCFLVQRLKILAAHPGDFVIGTISMLGLQGAQIFAVLCVMNHVPRVQGWTLDEILLVHGLVALSRSLNHMVADNLWIFGRHYVQTGQFDRFLLRPIDPLFHLLADRFCQDGVGQFLVGLVIVIKASLGLGLAWGPLDLALLVVAVIAGGLIFFAVNLVTGASAFWILDPASLMRVVFDLHQLAQYPLHIYGRPVRVLLTWVVPYGLAAFYPAAYVLDRGRGVMAWIALPVAIVLVLLAYRLWSLALRRYASTGS